MPPKTAAVSPASFQTFGELLKYLRRRAQLTQLELATAVGYGEPQISRLEQNQRLPDISTLAALFVPALDLQREPEWVARLLALAEEARNGRVPDARQTSGFMLQAVDPPLVLPSVEKPSSPPALPRHNLPLQLTPFVGRQTELQQCLAFLSDPTCRLLTLVGPGGMGKTRLALQAATLLSHEQRAMSHESFQPDGASRLTFDVSRFRDGIFFMPLAALSSPEFIVPAMAEALKLTGPSSRLTQTQLLNALQDKQMLLLLDNIEHLLRVELSSTGQTPVDTVELLLEILQRAPAIKLFITSRERLNVQGEQVFDLAGLEVPDSERAEQVETCSAVQLFLQRARWVQTSFTPADEDLTHIVRICRLVAGLPLGIELAAAWVRLLPVAEIAREIERNLDFLATSQRNVPERHRTVRAVFDHSWYLLSLQERRALHRLSVLRGGFGREAAQQIAGATLPLLAGLVDKSLLRMNAQGRYDMHELVRQYAAQKLGESGERELIHNQHLAYFLSLAERAEPKLESAEQELWLERLEVEHDNLRAALVWALRKEQDADQQVIDCDPTAALLLAGSLGRFWYLRGHLTEGRGWLEQALQMDDGRQTIDDGLATLHPSQRAKASKALGMLLSYQGAAELARYWVQQSLDLYREVGDRQGTADALILLGHIMAWLQDDYRQGSVFCAEGLALQRALGNPAGIASGLFYSGLAAVKQGDFAMARTRYEESITVCRQMNYTYGIATVLSNLAFVDLQLEDTPSARTRFAESLSLYRTLNSRYNIARLLNDLGDISRYEGDIVQAQAQYEESLTLAREFDLQYLIADVLHSLAWIALKRGQSEGAARRFAQSLSSNQALGSKRGIAECLAGIAGLLAAQGQLTPAVRLFSATQALMDTTGVRLEAPDRVQYERDLTWLKSQLSPNAFAAAWAEGQALVGQAAIADALQALQRMR